MVTLRVKIYVEGGGHGSQLKSECRKGFKSFFEKAGLKGVMPSVVACGSRRNAYDDFCIALKNSAADELPLLLVDSEGPVSRSNPWDHLREREGDKWERPDTANERHAHLMVQCMESWFLADREALARFFGPKFATNVLPANHNVEEVAKRDVFDGLKASTKSTPSQSYIKGKHGFRLLAEIDPTCVGQASAWAKRLIDTLRAVKLPSTDQ